MVRLLFNCHFRVPLLQSSAIWQNNLHLAQNKIHQFSVQKTHLYYVCLQQKLLKHRFRISAFRKLSKNLQFLGHLPCLPPPLDPPNGWLIRNSAGPLCREARYGWGSTWAGDPTFWLGGLDLIRSILEQTKNPYIIRQHIVVMIHWLLLGAKSSWHVSWIMIQLSIYKYHIISIEF